MIRTEKVTFTSNGETIVGTLYLPEASGKHPAVVTDGPLTSVKEQATGNHARAMAERGFVALAFDHRFFGESGGSPRQYESPSAKIEDLHAALDFVAKRPEVDDDRVAVLGVCAGAGYAAGVVATDPRVRAFGTVAGFFHDAVQQRSWMGERFDPALAEAAAAKQRYAETGVAETIPAVGKGDGRKAATIGGAVAGGAIGHHVEKEHRGNYASFRFVVEMDDGRTYVTEQGDTNGLRRGDRVAVEGGEVVPLYR